MSAEKSVDGLREGELTFFPPCLSFSSCSNPKGYAVRPASLIHALEACGELTVLFCLA